MTNDELLTQLKNMLSGLRVDMVTKADIARMATKDDISDMATKDDLSNMATKMDIAGMATKGDIADMVTTADVANMATKDDISNMATKDDITNLTESVYRIENNVASLRVEMNQRFDGLQSNIADALSNANDATEGQLRGLDQRVAVLEHRAA